MPLGRLTALFVVAAKLSWENMVGDLRSAADVYASGKAVLAVAARAVSALAEGFEAAQRAAVDQENSARTDLVDERSRLPFWAPGSLAGRNAR